MGKRSIQEQMNKRLHTRKDRQGLWGSVMLGLFVAWVCVTMIGSGASGAPVATADDFNWLPYVVLLLVSGAGVLILAVWRLFKENNRRSSRK